MSKAFVEAMAERLRQVSEEGFDAARDDAHAQGDIAVAAAAYAVSSAKTGAANADTCLLVAAKEMWPWDAAWWKPSRDPRRNIIKAMALLAAEYERLERAEAAQAGEAETEIAWSNNGEDYHSELTDVLNEDHAPGDIVHVGDARRFVGSDFTGRNDESIIDDIKDRAFEEMGEYADGYLDDLLHELDHPARVVLRNFIDAWADEYGPPGFYGVENVRDYVLTEEDVQS